MGVCWNQFHEKKNIINIILLIEYYKISVTKKFKNKINPLKKQRKEINSFSYFFVILVFKKYNAQSWNGSIASRMLEFYEVTQVRSLAHMLLICYSMSLSGVILKHRARIKAYNISECYFLLYKRSNDEENKTMLNYKI